jgi:hypothetical protein
LGDAARSGVVDAGVAVSDGTDDVRLSQPDKNPPLFAFNAAAFASTTSSGFFSRIRQPVGTWSSAIVVLARMEASQAADPRELRKWASGLFRVKGRFRVNLRQAASSFEA